jgi:hypothetical protein
MRRFAALAIAALAITACSSDDVVAERRADDLGYDIDFCGACAAAVQVGALASDTIDEASGLSSSQLHDDIFYVVNDSDTLSVFVIDRYGAVVGTIGVGGAQIVDWEDMARGPCPGGSCLYIGDIGDNGLERTSYQLYRIVEPTSIPVGVQTIEAEVLSFTYPDGPHNVQVLLVDPASAEIFVVTSDTPRGVYRFPGPLRAGASVELERVGSVAFPEDASSFTSGSVHPARAGVLLRTSSAVLFYSMRPASTVGEALLQPPCVVPDAAQEGDHECVGWLASGTGYALLAERVGAALHVVECDAPDDER